MKPLPKVESLHAFRYQNNIADSLIPSSLQGQAVRLRVSLSLTLKRSLIDSSIRPWHKSDSSVSIDMRLDGMSPFSSAVHLLRSQAAQHSLSSQ